MKLEAEKYLWERIPDEGSVAYLLPEIIQEMEELGMVKSFKEVHASLEKWADSGCWEYGVSLRTGWKTGKIPRRLQ